MTDPTHAPFPIVQWGIHTVTFDATLTQPSDPRDWAAVAFARASEGYVLGDIAGRGWTTPSGRIEPGETPLQAVIRETFEEIGAELLDARPLGRYLLTDPQGATRAAATFIGRVERFGAIPAGSESLGAACFAPEELPAAYYHWDDLMARVYALARRAAGE